MAIVNRDLDTSQQRLNFNVAPGLIGTGIIIPITTAPCNVQILNLAVAAGGLSGSPTVGLQLQRFVPGVGFTTIALQGSSLATIVTIGTSGIQSNALAPIIPAATLGTTLMTVLKNDVIQLLTATANTAATYYSIQCVLQVLQDIKSDFGS